MFKPHYSQTNALADYAMSCNARMRAPYYRFMLNWFDINDLINSRYSRETIESEITGWMHTYYITYDGIDIKIINIKNGEIERTFKRTEF